MVEELTIIAIVGFLVVASVYVFNENNKQKRGKSKVKTSQDVITDSILHNTKQLQESFMMQIQNLKDDLKHTQGQYAREKKKRMLLETQEEQDAYQQEEGQEEAGSILDTMEIDKEVARPFLQKYGMNVDALDNPALASVLMEKVKGNEELLTMIGILKPKGSVSTVPAKDNQSAIDATVEALAKSGNIA